MKDEGLWAAPYSEPPTYVRFKGVWDMQDIYETVADWFMRRKYRFRESVYKHKHPSPYGIERQYIWEATRIENDFFQIKYVMFIHTYDAQDIEAVTPDGSKRIFTKGRIWIEIKFKVITDWEGLWKNKLFYARLKAFYNKYILRKNFTQGIVPKIRYEMYELQSILKAKMKMEADEYEHLHRGGVHRRF
ncbi:hypothetical protein KY358_03365 [Candidatus Woesearchaeota archaeon]|nr:hypothetical protein [Candidatus Woesearchaeota archaeon]